MKFRIKLILIAILPVVLATFIAIYVSSSMLKKQGRETLEHKTKAVLSKMEAIRSYVATQFELESEIEELKKKYPDDEVPENEKLSILRKVSIFASMAVGAKNSGEDNYTSRVAFETARNKKNTATPQEIEFIRQFKKILSWKT